MSHNLLVGSRWGLTSDTLAVTMLAIGLARGGGGIGLRGNVRMLAQAVRRGG